LKKFKLLKELGDLQTKRLCPHLMTCENARFFISFSMVNHASMTAQLIDGKSIAASLRQQIAQRVAERRQQGLRTPGLAVILVGSDPASRSMSRTSVRTVKKSASSRRLRPARNHSEALTELIDRLNDDPAVDGILLQLPLPAPGRLAAGERIRPDKDVDGFHPYNIGRLAQRIRCCVRAPQRAS
jgi:methylenetetrahydrofolate dehydrogenase (NADP+)/methenyltetrahydrofolate cyclohydrolase